MATHSTVFAWKISMDRGAWWATVHGVTKSQTQLSGFHFHFFTFKFDTGQMIRLPKVSMPLPRLFCCSHESYQRIS